MQYFRTLAAATRTTLKGLGVTLRHLLGARQSRMRHDVEREGYFREPEGIFTMSFPEERMEVPTVGRYTLDCEIDDCIVCDKCARVCPVNCIDIVPVKSAEVYDHTSDGTAKRIYAAKFDIDMSKCCFCGLCTTVCPTECLTMTSDYDHVVEDTAAMNFQFATMSPEETRQKQVEYDRIQGEKAAAKAAIQPAPPASSIEPKPATEGVTPAAPKPPYRPVIRKPAAPAAKPEEVKPAGPEAATPSSEVQPAPTPMAEEPKAEASAESTPTAKPYRPIIRKPNPPKPDSETGEAAS